MKYINDGYVVDVLISLQSQKTDVYWKIIFLFQASANSLFCFRLPTELDHLSDIVIQRFLNKAI